MAVALLVAGQFGAPAASLAAKQKATSIQPGAVDFVRAVDAGMTFPATALARDVSIAVARREAAMIEAGFAKTVTLAQAPVTESEAPAVAAPVSATALPQTIVQSETRIEKPQLRSKTGETIVVAEADLERTVAGGLGAVPSSGGIALAEQAQSPDIENVLVRLAQEAHERSGKPAMSAQAISDYLSLYTLKARVAAIGDAIAQEPDAPVGGVWVANLGGGLDDALFQGGMAFGQTAAGAVGGFDQVAQNVFSHGDTLIFGGFAGAFALTPQDTGTFAGRTSETRGGSFGLFASLEDGPFTLSALIRADASQTSEFSSPNQLDFSDAMQVLKAEVVARYRFDVSDWVVEPSAGLSYATGRREVVGLGPASPTVEEAESLKFQLGVKASGVVYNKSGMSVEPSVTIMIAEELKDQGNVTFLSGSPTGPADPIKGSTVGSVSIGVDIKDDSGWTGFVRADGQVSDEDKPSAGVSAGVKTQW
jgi:outer membrane autotransporter protein